MTKTGNSGDMTQERVRCEKASTVSRFCAANKDKVSQRR
jgi:hypothetical protein